MALITCENAAFFYDGRPVAKDINFAVDEGDYLCIIGENGSGKSTLIKGILGLKTPESGTITYGEGLNRSEIGYLPQQTQIQKDFPASVFEVVLSGCLNQSGYLPFYSKKMKLEAMRNMEKLGIEKMKKDCYMELSGGQQQRVLLARALCAARRLLVLDEPVTGLDPVVTGELYQLIVKLNREDKIAVIMVSHDVGSAVRYASHILQLHDKPLFFGRREDYLASDLGKNYVGGVKV
ncbi:metal ABC transporter ATP-binding protein [Anaerolentibacter hominis]|uniref:metal ABC transporter ATP-binding protein n=1 Tax=Anaerolentibacter hominis TaxID=3079009 RepID=UPI0031B8AB85